MNHRFECACPACCTTQHHPAASDSAVGGGRYLPQDDDAASLSGFRCPSCAQGNILPPTLSQKAALPWHLYSTHQAQPVLLPRRQIHQSVQRSEGASGSEDSEQKLQASSCAACGYVGARDGSFWSRVRSEVLGPAAEACQRAAALSERVEAEVRALRRESQSSDSSSRSSVSQGTGGSAFVEEDNVPSRATLTSRFDFAVRLSKEAADLFEGAARMMQGVLAPGNRLVGETWHRAGKASLMAALVARRRWQLQQEKCQTAQDLGKGALPRPLDGQDEYLREVEAAASRAEHSFCESVTCLKNGFPQQRKGGSSSGGGCGNDTTALKGHQPDGSPSAHTSISGLHNHGTSWPLYVILEKLHVVLAKGFMDSTKAMVPTGGSSGSSDRPLEALAREREEVERALVAHFGRDAARDVIVGLEDDLMAF